MKKKIYMVEVTRRVTTVETTNISVEADNATEGKGIAKYKAERDNYEWTPGKNEITVLRSRIID